MGYLQSLFYSYLKSPNCYSAVVFNVENEDLDKPEINKSSNFKTNGIHLIYGSLFF